MRLKAVCLGLVLVLISSIGTAWAIGVGGTPPSFRVVSGDGQVMTSSQTRGKIVVIFYTSRKTRDRNETLADTLQHFLYQQPANVQNMVVPLPIVDTTEANLATKIFWQSEMKKSSRTRGLTVYGDWDGQMKASWRMVENESNVVILNRSGVVVYNRAGVIPRSEYEPIIQLLKGLVGTQGS